jgi:HEAT repeat protein
MRPAVACSTIVLFGFVTAPARSADSDPEYDGKKASAWVDVLRNDNSARKRAMAVTALGRVWAEHQYKDALPSIGRALRLDASPAVRTQAAVVIGQLKAEDARSVASDVVDAIKGEKESRVRREIASAITRFPEIAKTAVSPLTDVLKDSDPGTRAAAAEALGVAGAAAGGAAPDLLPLLADAEKPVRLAAVVALGRVAPEAPSTVGGPLAKMLAAEKDADLKRELVTSLGLLGDRSEAVVVALAGVLADPDEELRQRTARVLGTFGTAGKPAADALLKVAGNLKEKKGLRVDAVRAFGSALGAELRGRAKDLIALLDKDPDFEVRIAIVEEFAALGHDAKDDKETIAALRRRMSDPQVKVREAAAQAIDRINKPPKKPTDKPPEKKP